jgi:hypothetical protein
MRPAMAGSGWEGALVSRYGQQVERRCVLQDLAMIAIVVAFFGLTWGLVLLFEKL